MSFSLVVAMDRKLGIGKGGTLPWRLPSDLAYFHDLTTGRPPAGKRNAVIMGRTTWESIPEKRRPLMHRLNVIITSQPRYPLPDGVVRVGSLAEAIMSVTRPEVHEVFVIGGGRVFSQAIGHPDCQRLYVTEVDAEVGADTFFPPIPSDYKKVKNSSAKTENGLSFRFVVYERTA